MPPTDIRRNRRFSDLTSLSVGGPARALVEARNLSEAHEALEFAHDEALEIVVLGGGSNLLVSDDGFDGLVLRYMAADTRIDGSSGHVRSDSGQDWDTLVHDCVGHGLAGLECTVGIPGRVGAAPIQNVGAYGQEVAEVLQSVETLELASGDTRRFSNEDCEFAYRHSRFKGRDRGRYLITAVEFQLSPGGAPCLDYAELQRSFSSGHAPSLRNVSARVLELRRAKGMLLEDPRTDLRSAGSFFTNPILDEDAREELHRRLQQLGRDPQLLPAWPVDGQSFKCSAAWLIEVAGFERGERRGRVGLSDHHVLALVNRGGASARELLDFAREVRDRVFDATGVRLVPEPVPLGFDRDETADLWGN